MPTPLALFLARWQSAGGAERANYQLFLTELCDLLNVPHPDPTTPDDSRNNYVFDRAITATKPDGTTSPNFIDLYKRAHFVLETKQGIEKQQPPTDPLLRTQHSGLRTKKGHGIRGTKMWDDSLLRAKAQAEAYVRSIKGDNPPFLLVIDVGYSFETYSDFSGLGKTYTPFPDNLSHRFKLTDLADPARGSELLDRLTKIWTDPQSLNPARRTAKVTRKIAAHLAELSKSLEKSGHHPEAVAHFLMRVLFTLFAEDVQLIPNNAFTDLLESLKDTPDKFAPMAMAVWQNMDHGGFSPVLREDLLRFNGGLFADTQALKLTGNQLELLIEAAHQDWSDVEPAIFGTLLERALDPAERHKLGAHYTPRAYVERLVLPTVIEPLREEWSAAKTNAIAQANKGTGAGVRAAIKTVGDFLKHLCSVIILDPACGTANFLYVTLEHLKRLEGEVHDFLHQLAPNAQLPLEFTGLTVDPHQLRGIEINPRAAAIADLVLWIGYLQWHFRTHGHTMPQEPVLKKFDNIECRDAVLAYDKKELARDEHGKPLTRWDGVTFNKHPATGEDVPNESAQMPTYNYLNPRKADWPNADYVVGNPPFIGNKRMRAALGDGYVEALRAAQEGIPENMDFVMYWWNHAADLVGQGKLSQFGLITTNSIAQGLSRQVVEHQLAAKPQRSLVFVVPDHPWVESADGASVRIAMTVMARGDIEGTLCKVQSETQRDDDEYEVNLSSHRLHITANLDTGVDVTEAIPLRSNLNICFQGMILVGEGFRLEPGELEPLGLEKAKLPPIVHPYLGGKDLVQRCRERYVIDFYGYSEMEARQKFPAIYQRVYDTVRPLRLQNQDAQRKRNWWLFGRSNEALRTAISDLNRFIVTVETSKHKPFVFVSRGVCPDHKLYVIASEDALHLGIMSSRIHQAWALAAGGTLEDRPTWTNTTCFSPFPFPDCTEKQKSRIRKIAEELDAHRKRQQQKFPDLTLTDMYNILQKLRGTGVPPVSPDSGADAPVGSPASPIGTATIRERTAPLPPNTASPRPGTPTHAPAQLPITNYQLPSPPSPIHSAAFSPKEKQIHDHGLISILKQLHDELDAAVFDAYNWPPSLTDDQLLEKLVALNHQRAQEEKRGLIKYLRPEFQAGAKEFLRLETIPRLAKAISDFPYFSLQAIRADLREHNISVEPATLPRYLHDLTKEGVIFDAGRGWYSTLAQPFALNREPVRKLVGVLEARFPFLDFAAWSTEQIAARGHHLLSKFLTFVYAPKDAMESIADALREEKFTVYTDPSSRDLARDFRIDEKTVVIRPWISRAPVEGKFANIEKILPDLFVESAMLNLMDAHEFKRLMFNILCDGRIALGALLNYAKDRRDINPDHLFGRRIN